MESRERISEVVDGITSGKPEDIAAFLRRADGWLNRLRASLDRGDAKEFAACLNELESIESGARMLITRLKNEGVDATPHKYALLKLIHQLGRKALVCSALSENQAHYARVGQSLARPAREYDQHGSLMSATPVVTQWEA